MPVRTDAGVPPRGSGSPPAGAAPTITPFALPQFAFPVPELGPLAFARRRLPFGIEAGEPAGLQLRGPALAQRSATESRFPAGPGPIDLARFSPAGISDLQPAGRGLPQILLGQAQRAGLFSPFGPPAQFFDPIRSEILRAILAGAQQRRTAASLMAAGDPALRAFLELQGEVQGQSDLARALGAARAQFQQGQLDFFRDLLRQFFGGVQQREAIREQ